MAELKEEKVDGVFGGVDFTNVAEVNSHEESVGVFGGVDEEEPKNNASNLPTQVGFWNKFKAFWLQEVDWNKEIKVELTPYQQKMEDEINEFLHQEITWKRIKNFLFQDFGSKNKNK